MSNAMTHMVAALTSPPKPRAKPADVWQIPYMKNGKLRQFRPRGLTKTLLRSLEAAEKAQPVAYRIECKWRDPTLDQTWQKYADYGTRKAAESSQQVFANHGDVESRIIPLFAGEPEDSR